MKQVVHLSADRTHPACNYLHDIEFARRPNARVPSMPDFLPLKMQILSPSHSSLTSTDRLPLVVFVNGGGYLSPKMYIRIPWLARLAERGYIVAMPQYRGSDVAAFPAMVQDVRTAIRFLRSHADDFSIDPDRIVLMGGSAGGHASLLATYGDERFDAPDDDLSVSAAVCGVLDLYGPTDLLQMVPKDCSELESALSFWGQWFGGIDIRRHPEAVAPSIVSRYLHAGVPLPPAFIAHGDADQLVPYHQSEILFDALNAAGQDVEFYCLDGADHVDPAFFTEPMMDRYADFINRVVNKKK